MLTLYKQVPKAIIKAVNDILSGRVKENFSAGEAMYTESFFFGRGCEVKIELVQGAESPPYLRGFLVCDDEIVHTIYPGSFNGIYEFAHKCQRFVVVISDGQPASS